MTRRRRSYSRRKKKFKMTRARIILLLAVLFAFAMTAPVIHFSTLTLADSVWQLNIEFAGLQVGTHNYFSQSDFGTSAVITDWGQYQVSVDPDGPPEAIASYSGGYSANIEKIGTLPGINIHIQDIMHVDGEGNKIPSDQPSEPVSWDGKGGELKVFYYDFSLDIATDAKYNTTSAVVFEGQESYYAAYIRVALKKSIFDNPVQAWYAGAEIKEVTAKLTDDTPIDAAQKQGGWTVTPHIIPANRGSNLNAYKDENNKTLVIIKTGATLRAGFIEQQSWDITKGFPTYRTVKNVEVLYRIRVKIVTYTPPITDPEKRQEMNSTHEVTVTPQPLNPLGDLYNAFGDLGGFFNSPGGMVLLVALIVIFSVIGLIWIKK